MGGGGGLILLSKKGRTQWIPKLLSLTSCIYMKTRFFFCEKLALLKVT